MLTFIQSKQTGAIGGNQPNLSIALALVVLFVIP